MHHLKIYVSFQRRDWIFPGPPWISLHQWSLEKTKGSPSIHVVGIWSLPSMIKYGRSVILTIRLQMRIYKASKFHPPPTKNLMREETRRNSCYLLTVKLMCILFNLPLEEAS